MLSRIWNQQRSYNKRIFGIEGTEDKHYWARQYILGIASQIAELLKAVRWKRHRNENGKKVVPLNVLEEIADIMKYAISLAQIWGFSEEDLMKAIYEKGEILDFRLNMEFKEPLKGRKILITDLDGTLVNYAESFKVWAHDRIQIPNKEITSLLLDESLEMNYPEYYKLKEQFEESGGYRYMLPYDDAEKAMRYMYHEGFYIIAVTSRPEHIYKRMFKDTLFWLKSRDIRIDELHMIGAGRILMACDLMKENEVMFWEDDPEMIKRAANSGIRTYARKQNYNKHLNIPAVTFVDSYYDEVITWDE